jgi:hypothetical protein
LTFDLPVQDALGRRASSAADPKMHQRFGPEEDYLLAVQVNVDAPFMAEDGEVNKKWQRLADKLNPSPNFNMKAIKGTTAKARFKALLSKHRHERRSPRTRGARPERIYIGKHRICCSQISFFSSVVLLID